MLLPWKPKIEELRSPQGRLGFTMATWGSFASAGWSLEIHWKDLPEKKESSQLGKFGADKTHFATKSGKFWDFSWRWWSLVDFEFCFGSWDSSRSQSSANPMICRQTRLSGPDFWSISWSHAELLSFQQARPCWQIGILIWWPWRLSIPAGLHNVAAKPKRPRENPCNKDTYITIRYYMHAILAFGFSSKSATLAARGLRSQKSSAANRSHFFRWSQPKHHPARSLLCLAQPLGVTLSHTSANPCLVNHPASKNCSLKFTWSIVDSKRKRWNISSDGHAHRFSTQRNVIVTSPVQRELFLRISRRESFGLKRFIVLFLSTLKTRIKTLDKTLAILILGDWMWLTSSLSGFKLCLQHLCNSFKPRAKGLNRKLPSNLIQLGHM